MPKFKDVERMGDIKYTARALFDDYSGGREVIYDVISGFTSTRPNLGETPQNVIDAITDWIANSDAVLYDEDD